MRVNCNSISKEFNATGKWSLIVPSHVVNIPQLIIFLKPPTCNPLLTNQSPLNFDWDGQPTVCHIYIFDDAMRVKRLFEYISWCNKWGLIAFTYKSKT